MKIICKDNFDRDTVSESVVAEKVHEMHAKVIVDALNARFSGPSSPNFFKAEPDNYTPYKWEP